MAEASAAGGSDGVGSSSGSTMLDACFLDQCTCVCDTNWTPCGTSDDELLLMGNEPVDYVVPAGSPRRPFMSGKAEMETLEAASRVAIHAFFREYKPQKASYEVDAMVARYEARNIGPRALLQLIETAFHKGRDKRLRETLLLSRSAAADRDRPPQMLYLTNGSPGTDEDAKEETTPPRGGRRERPAATLDFRGLAATPQLFNDGKADYVFSSPLPPPGPNPSPVRSQSPTTPRSPKYVSPVPSPTTKGEDPRDASPPKRTSIKVGKTTVTLSPDCSPASSMPPSPTSSESRNLPSKQGRTSLTKLKKKKTKKKKSLSAMIPPLRAPPGTAYAP